MKSHKIIVIASLLGLVSCVSGPKYEMSYDYVISDASEKNRPEWIGLDYVQRLNDKEDGYKYFLGENDNLASQKSRSLCKNASEANARKTLASVISANIKSEYNDLESALSDSDNLNSTSDTKMALSIDNVVNGAEVVKYYWEERNHKISMNALKDYKSYTCFSLLRVSDTVYKNIVDIEKSDSLN